MWHGRGCRRRSASSCRCPQRPVARQARRRMRRWSLPRSTTHSTETRTTSHCWSSARPGSGPLSTTARPSAITRGRCGSTRRTVRPHRPGRAAVAPRALERSPAAAAACHGGRSRPRGGLVLPRRGAQSCGRPHGRAGRLRAGGGARAPQRPGAAPPRHRARSPEPARRSDSDVSPLPGGRRPVIRVVVNYLAFRSADAIVRPATTRLDPTTPAVRRLETVGGAEFSRHLQLQKELPVGAAVVTAGGGDLPADFVIHAVIRSDTEPVTRDGVARAWRSTLQQVQEWEFGTVTVPPIGTGAGNLTVEDAAEIMVPILKVHLGSATFPVEVSVVVETAAERDVFETALRRSEAGQS